jgi:cytochrome c-type biogenesis protein CcmE
MLLVGLMFTGAASAAALLGFSFQENIDYFVMPTDLIANKPAHDRSYRVSGMVKDGSIHRAAGSLEVSFTITDYQHDLPATYTGVLPDLFGEGQGVVARGRIVDGKLWADHINARHDENYMPPDVAEKLKAAHGGKLPANKALPLK